MIKNDRLGKLYEGRWKVIAIIPKRTSKYHDSGYKLQNIFNNMIVELDAQSIRKIEKGQTTIGKICHIRLKRKHIGGYKF